MPGAPAKSSSSPVGSPATPKPEANTSAPFSPFVPLLVFGLTLVIWLGFQSVQLLGERSNLAAAYAAQQTAVDSATKLRGSLDGLAADTQRLAESGNPNAALLVGELRKRGITINPNATPPAAAGSAPG